METRRSNETFKLKLIHKHWFIEAGGKLHRLSFLKGARSVQIEDNVISADGCMYQVQLNYRKEVKVEKIDDICIYDEPSNEQLSHNTEEEFESIIKDGIHNEKGVCSYDPDIDQEEWISDNDECDAGDQYGQGSDECDVEKQYGRGSEEYVTLAYDDTQKQDRYREKTMYQPGRSVSLDPNNENNTHTINKGLSVSEDTDDITYQGSLELNHGTLAQSLSDSFGSLNASKKEEDLSDSFGSLNASKEKDISGQSFQKGRPGFLSRFFTNKFQHSEPRQSSKPSIVQLFVPRETATTKDFPNAMKILFKDISFKCIPFAGIGMLSDRSPLVVVCPKSSRFESDIDCAIDGIQWKKTFVVLLLHSGLESCLPRISTACKLAYNEKYKNIVFIDIAYTKDAKLYQCQMNEKAKDQLKSFFSGFYNK